MAATAAKIDEQSTLAAKVEVTTGTAEALTAAEGAFNVFNAKITPNVGFNERQGQLQHAPLPGVAGLRLGSADFEVELVGKGAVGVPSWASTFLVACGFAATGQTYNPVTGDPAAPTLTIGNYEDGLFRAIAGASGRFKLVYETGKPVRVQFHFEGVYQTETDTALIAPTLPTVAPPVFMGSTFTIGGYTPKVSKLEIDVNNKLYVRPGQGPASGLISCAIVGRKVTCRLDPEAEAIATRDWYTKMITNATEAFSVAIGSVANNTQTITSASAQTTKVPKGARGGITTKDIEMQFNRSAGDDEIAIVFS